VSSKETCAGSPFSLGPAASRPRLPTAIVRATWLLFLPLPRLQKRSRASTVLARPPRTTPSQIRGSKYRPSGIPNSDVRLYAGRTKAEAAARIRWRIAPRNGDGSCMVRGTERSRLPSKQAPRLLLDRLSCFWVPSDCFFRSYREPYCCWPAATFCVVSLLGCFGLQKSAASASVRTASAPFQAPRCRGAAAKNGASRSAARIPRMFLV
jgi:hypothetical protein